MALAETFVVACAFNTQRGVPPGIKNYKARRVRRVRKVRKVRKDYKKFRGH